MATGNLAAGKTDDEAQIRRLVEEWREVIGTRDLDRLEKLYEADILFFDVTPPYVRRGVKTYAEFAGHRNCAGIWRRCTGSRNW